MPEARRKNIRLSVMAVWFMEHPSFAKKTYMTIVIAIAATYIPSVEPIKTPLHALESYASICSKQYSAQLCARSTRRTRPSRRKSMAAKNEMYGPQTIRKNDCGIRNDTTIRPSQAMILGPQKPFWIAARGFLEELTPKSIAPMMTWNIPRAKLILCTATHP